MDYYMIGQKIRKFRKSCGLSQEQLAEEVGISTTHLSHIETGNTKLSLPCLLKLLQLCQCKPMNFYMIRQVSIHQPKMKFLTYLIHVPHKIFIF